MSYVLELHSFYHLSEPSLHQFNLSFSLTKKDFFTKNSVCAKNDFLISQIKYQRLESHIGLTVKNWNGKKLVSRHSLEFWVEFSSFPIPIQMNHQSVTNIHLRIARMGNVGMWFVKLIICKGMHRFNGFGNQELNSFSLIDEINSTRPFTFIVTRNLLFILAKFNLQWLLSASSRIYQFFISSTLNFCFFRISLDNSKLKSRVGNINNNRATEQNENGHE